MNHSQKGFVQILAIGVIALSLLITSVITNNTKPTQYKSRAEMMKISKDATVTNSTSPSSFGEYKCGDKPDTDCGNDYNPNSQMSSDENTARETKCVENNAKGMGCTPQYVGQGNSKKYSSCTGVNKNYEYCACPATTKVTDFKYGVDSQGFSYVSWSHDLSSHQYYSVVVKDNNGSEVYVEDNLKENTISLYDGIFPKNKSYTITVTVHRTGAGGVENVCQNSVSNSFTFTKSQSGGGGNSQPAPNLQGTEGNACRDSSPKCNTGLNCTPQNICAKPQVQNPPYQSGISCVIQNGDQIIELPDEESHMYTLKCTDPNPDMSDMKLMYAHKNSTSTTIFGTRVNPSESSEGVYTYEAGKIWNKPGDYVVIGTGMDKQGHNSTSNVYSVKVLPEGQGNVDDDPPTDQGANGGNHPDTPIGGNTRSGGGSPTCKIYAKLGLTRLLSRDLTTSKNNLPQFEAECSNSEKIDVLITNSTGPNWILLNNSNQKSFTTSLPSYISTGDYYVVVNGFRGVANSASTRCTGNPWGWGTDPWSDCDTNGMDVFTLHITDNSQSQSQNQTQTGNGNSFIKIDLNATTKQCVEVNGFWAGHNNEVVRIFFTGVSSVNNQYGEISATTTSTGTFRQILTNEAMNANEPVYAQIVGTGITSQATPNKCSGPASNTTSTQNQTPQTSQVTPTLGPQDYHTIGDNTMKVSCEGTVEGKMQEQVGSATISGNVLMWMDDNIIGQSSIAAIGDGRYTFTFPDSSLPLLRNGNPHKIGATLSWNGVDCNYSLFPEGNGRSCDAAGISIRYISCPAGSYSNTSVKPQCSISTSNQSGNTKSYQVSCTNTDNIEVFFSKKSSEDWHTMKAQTGSSLNFNYTWSEPGDYWVVVNGYRNGATAQNGTANTRCTGNPFNGVPSTWSKCSSSSQDRVSVSVGSGLSSATASSSEQRQVRIISKAKGADGAYRCLSVVGGNASNGVNGARFETRDCADSVAYQEFILVPIPTLTQTYQIRPVSSPSMCVSVNEQDDFNDGKIHQWGCGSLTEKRQQWHLGEINNDPNTVVINTTFGTQKVLDKAWSGLTSAASNGDLIHEWEQNNYDNQQWEIRE